MSDLLINITVADVEVYWFPGSVRISRSTSSRSTCNFRVRALKATPEVGQSIGIFDRGKRIFGGTVQEVLLSPIAQKGGSEAWYDVTGTGWEHGLERRWIDATAYDTTGAIQTAGAIVADILQRYAEGDCWVGSIEEGADSSVLGTVIFKGITVAGAIEDLARRSNYCWYIDPEGWFYFQPRNLQYAISEVRASNLNYREPEIRIDRADYYNKASMTISYDAFAPITLDVQGDASYPWFDVYDPDDDLKTALPIDLIKSIRLNGVDQDFGMKVINDAGDIEDVHTFYWQQGSSRIEWDVDQPVPTPEDVVTVEFYPIGANVVTEQDDAEIEAVAAREVNSGIYQAFLEDMNCASEDVARERLKAFLDLHAPGRNAGHSPGEYPREYKWVSDSHKFANDDMAWVDDLMPGKLITFWPSTPETTQREVMVQSVEIQDLGSKNPELFRYTVTAIDGARVADYMDFYRALAELNPGSGGVSSVASPVLDVRSVVFGIDAPTVTDDIGWYVEIDVSDGQVWRPTSAWLCAHTAPSGSALAIDCSYSVDSGATWSNLFEDATGKLSLADGLTQLETPLGKFSGFPTPLDVPSGALVRCAVITASGANALVQIVGEVRKAVAVPPIV